MAGFSDPACAVGSPSPLWCWDPSAIPVELVQQLLLGDHLAALRIRHPGSDNFEAGEHGDPAGDGQPFAGRDPACSHPPSPWGDETGAAAH